MSARMKALLSMLAPVLVIGLMVIGVFALVGAGFDWTFVAGACGFTLLVSAAEFAPDLLAPTKES